jgi:D-3-phosphoglycerate dehydrogenase / 2-oxoglutarate reductase
VNSPKVLITDPVHPLLLQELEGMGYVVDYEPAIDQEGVIKVISEYTGLIINSKILAGVQLIDQGVRLKFIGRLGAGLEVIDQAYASAKGIKCFNTPEGNCDAVAEHAMGMLLGLMNHISRADAQVRKGQWLREPNRGVELGGKTVGIIGYGNTGAAFAKRLAGFDVQIMAYDKYKSGFGTGTVEETRLNAIYEHADVISLHVQLTSETNFLVNKKFIKEVKKPFYLINTSRGKVVNTEDLLWALNEGLILGAALDVLENEKLETFSEKELLQFERLVAHSNVLLTPHVAGWTKESKEKIAKTMAYKIKEIL